jgi:hypothetical protein
MCTVLGITAFSSLWTASRIGSCITPTQNLTRDAERIVRRDRSHLHGDPTALLILADRFRPGIRSPIPVAPNSQEDFIAARIGRPARLRATRAEGNSAQSLLESIELGFARWKRCLNIRFQHCWCPRLSWRNSRNCHSSLTSQCIGCPCRASC